MRIYPAVHYTMGGLWVDYDLLSTIPGLFVLGEANFSDHGANRLGASALMQGLADGYFVLPDTVGRLPGRRPVRGGRRRPPGGRRGRRRTSGRRSSKLLAIKGNRTVDVLPPRARPAHVGHCGMARNEEGLRRRSSASRAARGVLEQRQGRRRLATRSTSRSRRPAASPTSSSSPSSCASTPCTARELRRPLPRGEPDPRGRGPARRRELRVRRRLGVRRSGQPPVLHKEDLEFEYVKPPSGATSEKEHQRTSVEKRA